MPDPTANLLSALAQTKSYVQDLNHERTVEAVKSGTHEFRDVSDAQHWIVSLGFVPVISDSPIDVLGAGYAYAGVIWGQDGVAPITAQVMAAEDLPLEDIRTGKASIYCAQSSLSKSEAGDKEGHKFHGNQYTKVNVAPKGYVHASEVGKDELVKPLAKVYYGGKTYTMAGNSSNEHAKYFHLETSAQAHADMMNAKFKPHKHEVVPFKNKELYSVGRVVDAGKFAPEPELPDELKPKTAKPYDPGPGKHLVDIGGKGAGPDFKPLTDWEKNQLNKGPLKPKSPEPKMVQTPAGMMELPVGFGDKAWSELNDDEKKKALGQLAKIAVANQALVSKPKPAPSASLKTAGQLGKVMDQPSFLDDDSGKYEDIGATPAAVSKLVNSLTSKVGMPRADILEALSSYAATNSHSHLADARIKIESAILKSHTAVRDAIQVLKKLDDPQEKKDLIETLTKGDVKRAQSEYAVTPTYDLQCLNGISVYDHPIDGQALFSPKYNTVNMGETSVTGDFRHELGHAVQYALGVAKGKDSENAMLMTVAKHYATVKAAIKEHPEGMGEGKPGTPGGKMSHEWYETTYHVIGRRGADSWLEDFAELYRGYHKAAYMDDAQAVSGLKGGNLDDYRKKFPTIARLFDARYSAALIGRMAKKGLIK